MRPNILLITSDQHHYSALGVHNPKIKTPNLDRLCREGTNFSRAYCPNPTCTPTRASIITGQYPSQHGAWSLGTKLDESVPTIGDAFQAHGYSTTLVGKAHFQPLLSQPDQTSLESYSTLHDLDFWRNFHGPFYGFEHIELARNHADEAHVGQHYAIWMEEEGLADWPRYFQKGWPQNTPDSIKREGAWDLPADFHYTTWTAERTIAAIERSAQEKRPFFTWASFHDPHPPYLVPEPWASMYDPADMEPGTLQPGEMERLPPHFGLTQQAKPDYSPWRETPHGNHGFNSHLGSDEQHRHDMAIYYGMVSFMDEQIGRILDALDRLGLAQSTLIVFTTDHGHFLGAHGLWHKGAFHYEDALRLPFIVRWPDRVAANRQSSALQSLVDLAPTFLTACDIDVPGAMQGVNQLPVWCGQKEKARDEVLVEFRHQPTTVHLRTYIDERYKLTVYRDRNYGELFDLQDDPDERCNRWDDDGFAAIKAQLFQKFVNAELKREAMHFPRIAGA